jgi:hypothetical protein
VPKGLKLRRLHKAFLRWHDPDNWPVLREALVRMGRSDLIGSGEGQLVPLHDNAPSTAGPSPRGKKFRTQHTGVQNAAQPRKSGPRK